jgi:hypothetical protein
MTSPVFLFAASSSAPQTALATSSRPPGAWSIESLPALDTRRSNPTSWFASRLLVMPLLPFAMPKRVAAVAAIWVMLACSLGGLACLALDRLLI